MPRKIIIDTDPGQDDAIAILLAIAAPEELEILGLVTVAGNIGLAATTLNALKVLELGGRPDIPVCPGCERPFRRALVIAPHVHGESGLDGPDLPYPDKKAETIHGVDFLVDAFRAAGPGEVTLCTLGPLTNVAMALVKAPDIAGRIREIVMMGGAYFEVGNITPAAEFNIYVDPEAADIVLRAGVPVTMLPLDVTHGVLSYSHRVERMEGMGNRTGKAIAEMIRFSERFDLAKYESEGAPLHDPCVIAWLLEPEIFSGRVINVTVETQSDLTRGMTVADYWRITDRPRNVNYIRSANDERFYDLLIERLKTLP